MPFDDTDQMMALRNYNRFMQLFGQPQQVTSQDPAQIQNPATQYRPQHAISDMYTQSLMNMPQREQPSKWRQVGAALAGLSGFSPGEYYNGQPVGIKYNPEVGNAAADQFLNKKYYSKLGDWELRNKALGQGASEEERSNVNQRQLVLGEQLRATQQADLQRKIRADETAARIRQQRADTYDFKARNPDWKLVTQKGGNIWAFDPKNPERKFDTGLDSGTLSDMDKITLGVDSELQKIEARGEQAKELEGVKQPNRLEVTRAQGQNQLQLQGARTSGMLQGIGARGAQSRETKQTPAPPKPVPGPTESTATQYDAKGNVVGSIKRESGPKQPIDVKREQAIKILTDAKKPVTEANIKHVVDQLK